VLSADGASAFISSFLAELAQLPRSGRAAFIASVLDWSDLAPIAVGPSWQIANDEQRGTVLNALNDFVAELVAELPLRDAALVITDTDRQDSQQFRVMTSALVDDEATEITFWVFEQPDGGTAIGNVGVEGVSFLGRHRPQFTALAESRGLDALIQQLRAETAADGRQESDGIASQQPPQRGSRLTRLVDLDEREYFALFAKRTGMHIASPVSFRSVTAFIEGYDQAARRYGGVGLDGWREWLMTHHRVGGNLVWEAQVLQIAFPDWAGQWDLAPDQETHVLKVLFELLDKFLADRATPA